MSAIPPLFEGLCDDAAMFPPGNLPAAEAAHEHLRHRRAWYSGLVGPLLVAPDRLGALAAAAEPPLSVVLVVRGDRDTLTRALEQVHAEPALELAGVELAWTGPGGTKEAMAVLMAVLPSGIPAALEVGPGEGLAEALDVLAAGPFRAKFRTGGTTASAFPSEDELAAFVVGCVARDLPFKCTAGLHQAVRHTDSQTGFEHHGFLNLLAATHLAGQGAERAVVAGLLGVRSGAPLAGLLRDLTADQVTRVRRACTAYGTCSIAEPLADVTALHLLGSAAHSQEP